MTPRTSRKRQRSVRVTVSVSLLSFASALVAGGVVLHSLTALSVASLVSVVLAWAALRMMWTEVLQSRRENAADRAAAATAYRDLFAVRAAEHATFTTAMTKRVTDLQSELGRSRTDLSTTRRELVTAQADVASTRHELTELTRALNLKAGQVEALEVEIAGVRAEVEAAHEIASQWQQKPARRLA